MKRFSKLLHIIPLLVLAFIAQAKPLPIDSEKEGLSEYDLNLPWYARKAYTSSQVWRDYTIINLKINKAIKTTSSPAIIDDCMYDIKSHIKVIPEQDFKFLPGSGPIRIMNSNYYFSDTEWFPLEEKQNSKIIMMINFCKSLKNVR